VWLLCVKQSIVQPVDSLSVEAMVYAIYYGLWIPPGNLEAKLAMTVLQPPEKSK
jgi:hypothetical protein